MPKSKKPRKAKAAPGAAKTAVTPKQSSVPSGLGQGSIRKASQTRSPAKGGPR